MLKTFVGFKGKMAAAQIGKISFVLLAENDKQLSILWQHILKELPLDPAGIKSAILIEAGTLPERTRPRGRESDPSATTDPSDKNL